MVDHPEEMTEGAEMFRLTMIMLHLCEFQKKFPEALKDANFMAAKDLVSGSLCPKASQSWQDRCRTESLDRYRNETPEQRRDRLFIEARDRESKR